MTVGSERETRFHAFLRERSLSRRSFTVDDVVAATGWSKPTVKTYLGKKVRRAGLLQDHGPGTFLVNLPSAFSEADFRRLMSQVAGDGEQETEDAWQRDVERIVEVGRARLYRLSEPLASRVLDALRQMVVPAASPNPVADAAASEDSLAVVAAWIQTLPYVAREPAAAIAASTLEARPPVLADAVRGHLAAAEAAQHHNEFVDLAGCRAIAWRALQLIDRLGRLRGARLTIALVAVHYFALADDGEDDFASPSGFDDDAAVLDAAIRFLGVEEGPR